MPAGADEAGPEAAAVGVQTVPVDGSAVSVNDGTVKVDFVTPLALGYLWAIPFVASAKLNEVPDKPVTLRD